MPTIAAVPQPTEGRVYIYADFSDVTNYHYVALFRTDATNPDPLAAIADWQDGNQGEYPAGLVRPHTAVDTTGWYQGLSSGWTFWYDTEAPLDTPISYTAIMMTSGVAATIAKDVTLASGGSYWLRNPTRPYGDLQLSNTTPNASDCLPRQGIYFANMDVETYASQSNLISIDDSAYPIVAAKRRLANASTLTMVTRTFADRDEVLAQVAHGESQMFQAPAQYGIADQYMYTSDVPVTRPLSDHRRQWRVISEPFQAVQRPVGLSYGGIGLTWDELGSGPYQTWAQATAAGLTTQTMVVGLASAPGGGQPGFRTWADINAQFASWSVITSSGRTWLDVLDGA